MNWLKNKFRDWIGVTELWSDMDHLKNKYLSFCGAEKINYAQISAQITNLLATVDKLKTQSVCAAKPCNTNNAPTETKKSVVKNASSNKRIAAQKGKK